MIDLDQPIALRLKPKRHFPFHARHPWVHAHALAEKGENLTAGQVVDLHDFDGNPIARGIINPASRLRIRLYAFDGGKVLDEAFFRGRIDAAIARRRLTSAAQKDGAERLVFSESDGLSGLIVDRYHDHLGVQLTAAALARWTPGLIDHLLEVSRCQAAVVRVDPKTAAHEGIAATTTVRRPGGRTQAVGEASESISVGPVAYRQNGLDLSVDLLGGQKTGGYLDQRENHRVAAGYLQNRRVLDVCCYNGGFGLLAARRGAAEVVGVDSSAAALAAAAETAERNGIDGVDWVQGDCFETLEAFVEADRSFDAVVLDPPRFAGSRHQVDSALRAYRRLNSLAVDLMPQGGVLVTCSCSGRVPRSDFLNMLMDVGRRRRRDLIMLENRGPAADHPVSISCPETDYLKCVIATVDR